MIKFSAINQQHRQREEEELQTEREITAEHRGRERERRQEGGEGRERLGAPTASKDVWGFGEAVLHSG